jgi:hypothetical protein
MLTPAFKLGGVITIYRALAQTLRDFKENDLHYFIAFSAFGLKPFFKIYFFP